MKKYFITSFLLFAYANASAYEKVTHEKLSEEAAKASVLRSPVFLSQLGLSPKDISDDGYNLFNTSEGGADSILELIKFGANWEDGRGEKTQATRHFFNPKTGDALSVGPYVLTTPPFFIPKFTGIRSPDWALEDVPYDPGTLGLPQRFSYKSARSYFFEAVRLPEKADRDANWGLTFQSLGHVIHHIQDMAQPQHTRNDFHCDKPFCEDTGLLGGVKPSFEKWTLANTTASQLAGYDPVYTKDEPSAFKTPRMFWLVNDGNGIAEFSNRNFFTAGTNVDAAGVTPPQLLGGAGKKIDIAILCSEPLPSPDAACPAGIRGNMTFFETNVTDKLRGTVTVNHRATTRSVFAADLKKRFLGLEAYSVNRFTYAATNDFTLKRAVGYSAGMINYFFRGELDLKRATTSPEQFAIKNKGPDTMAGTFRLLYDTDDGRRHVVPNAEWSLSINAGQESAPFDIDLNVSPPPAQSNTFILVFNGKMGEETDGVAASVVTVKPPIEGLYVLATDTNGGRVVLRVNKQGTQAVTPTEFNPFQSDTVAPGVGRKYLQKQFAFFTTPSGQRVHKFQSLATLNGLRRITNVDVDGNVVSFLPTLSIVGPLQWVSTPETNTTADFYFFTLDAAGTLKWSRKRWRRDTAFATGWHSDAARVVPGKNGRLQRGKPAGRCHLTRWPDSIWALFSRRF